VKVVEGSEIYNVPIHHFEHFYSFFLSFKHSKQGTMTRLRAGRRRAATSRVARAPRPSRACLAVRARSRLPEVAPSQGWEHSKAHEVRAPQVALGGRACGVTCLRRQYRASCSSAQQGCKTPIRATGLLVARPCFLHLALAATGRPAIPARATHRC
jgi:hypothetical protein